MQNIPYEKMEFKWISGHHDIHLNGLCIVNKELYRFETDYNNFVCTVHKLTLVQKCKWVLRKKAFELCVGCHWTYPHRKKGTKFYYRKPKWFSRFLFNSYYKVKKAWQTYKQ